MKMKFSVIVSIVFLVSITALANKNSNLNSKVPANPSRGFQKSSALSEMSLTEELTGKKVLTPSAKAAQLKKAPLPLQHYAAGKNAATKKNYILAIKHFNTILKKYPQSAQVKAALLAKANVYKEMGLQPQAMHNLRIAQQNTQQNQQPKSQTVKINQALKTTDKAKVIK